MWLKFKWDMFVTSFIPLWVTIIVYDLWDLIKQLNQSLKEDDNLSEILCSFAYESIIQLISIMIIFIIVMTSIISINNFLKKKEDSHQNASGMILAAKKEKQLSAEFLLAYVLPLIAFNFNELKDLVLFLLYFIFLAFLCIRNNNFYTNIYLEFKKYRIYSCDIERYFPGNEKEVFHDSIIISKDDITLFEKKTIRYYDFDNYTYIHIEEKKANE
jgi:hypothetical protein